MGQVPREAWLLGDASRSEALEACGADVRPTWSEPAEGNLQNLVQFSWARTHCHGLPERETHPTNFHKP